MRVGRGWLCSQGTALEAWTVVLPMQARDTRELSTWASGDAQGHAGAAGRADCPDDTVCLPCEAQGQVSLLHFVSVNHWARGAPRCSLDRPPRHTDMAAPEEGQHVSPEGGSFPPISHPNIPIVKLPKGRLLPLSK